jgi:predicted AlkP superfamily pyrophosphatase or phosphodiesterase
VFDLWTYTPYANRYVLDSAVTAINENQLGADDIPDVLTINLSSNDYLGHAFGPYSPEVMQMSIETDEALSDFFRTLDAKIGLKNVAIAVTADHGVLPLAEDLTAQRIPSGRVDPGELFKKVNEKLESQFKVADLLMKGSTNEFMVYVDHELCNAHNLNLQTVIQAAKTELLQNKAVYRVFTSSDLESNQLSADILSQSTLASYRTDRSGDLIYFLRPGLLAGDGNTGTSHGTPWTYDQNVPLLFWVPGMSPGTYTDAAGPQDIAATLCHAMGIGEPNGSVGRILGKW